MEGKVILDLCGGTGAWSQPYKDAGFDVRLITLPDYDVRTYIPPAKVYGVLAAPPCTKFSRAAWQIKKADRDFEEGMECVRACMEIIWKIQENGAPLAFWALENPMGYLYNFLGKPAFYFQHWQFGEEGMTATKRTAIWGYFNEPKKTHTERTIGYITPQRPGSKWNSHSKIHRPQLFPDLTRSKENKAWYKASAEERAITCKGFAAAFFKSNSLLAKDSMDV